ncbi:MAG: hypothetical protein JWP30_1180 [Homoserinimonas sp.]|jgi:hypothetical protein|nr:hypothetical protein [Homoserinimonas sp.]
MRISLIAGTALAVAITLFAAGCTPQADLEPPKPTPTRTTTATPTPAPTASAEPGLACEDIVAPDTLELLDAQGYVLMEEHEDDVRAEDRIEAYFFDYGGLDCLWGVPSSDLLAVFGYSEITDSQALPVQNKLTAAGYVRAEQGADVTFSLPPDESAPDHEDWFLFTEGAWFHSSRLAGIEEIRQTVQ